jgi:hypothetical protein
MPQLPASNSKSSQQLNLNSSLTNSLIHQLTATELELLYGWWFTASQFFALSPLRLTITDFFATEPLLSFCLLCIGLAFVKCTYCAYIIENFSLYNTYKSYVIPVFGKQIMPQSVESYSLGANPQRTSLA